MSAGASPRLIVDASLPRMVGSRAHQSPFGIWPHTAVRRGEAKQREGGQTSGPHFARSRPEEMTAMRSFGRRLHTALLERATIPHWPDHSVFTLDTSDG